jgi:hypothetical protein
MIAIPALIVGGLVAYFSVLEFSTPSLTDNPNGSIAVSITGGSSKPVGIGINYASNGIVSYEILFPHEDIGQHWSFVLAGSARLDTVRPFVPAQIPVHSADCNALSTAGIETQATECQIFSGVASEGSGGANFIYGCPNVDNRYSIEKDDFSGFVEIDGRTPIDQSVNWAYKTVTYPSVLQGVIGNYIPAAVNPPYGIDAKEFTHGSQTAAAVVCDTMAAPSGYDDLITASPPPSSLSGNEEEWDNPTNDFVSTIFKRSGAETLANAGIIIAGACFAITTGFFPLSFQAWLENPKPRKRLESEKPIDKQIHSSRRISGLGWPKL